MIIATYRLQLQPGFGFEEVKVLLPYLRRLGISHLYLSPITDARRGSTHGYDVVDHNRIRDELGGPDSFWSLLKAARTVGLALILDIVPNHAGVGNRNARWQDVLAYGPHSPYAAHFDIDWQPLKPELQHKILLPFLGSPYGEALDRGEISIVFEGGRLAAAYGAMRFSLAPVTYADVLDAVIAAGDGAGRDAVADVGTLAEAFRALQPHERGRADELRARLANAAAGIDLARRLGRLAPAQVHAVLERQFWRLSYWKTAGSEINYRRFFDINDLVGLRMEREDVFADAHRLVARLAQQEGIEGVRVDHVDGLFDPHEYLGRLRALGVRIWVEKILARGETLPQAWPVEGTSGYEFANDVMGVLTRPEGELPLDRVYRRFVREASSYADEIHRSKRLVMETTLAGELFRLAYGLDRISEGDYHTRDFTFEALREALAEVVASFPRYRTYLPHDEEDAERVIREAVQRARARNAGAEPTVYAFIGQVLGGRVAPALRDTAASWAGRFEQYTASVTAKGIEDTGFYRYVRLAALNEVGGEPEHFGVTPHAFHARARFRALRYPRTLLATATHDHKRGEDLRMRLIVLAELPDAWRRTVGLLSRIARRHRSPAGPSRTDEYLLFQTLVASWHGADPSSLTERLVEYMRKAAREAKLRTSWLNPDPDYETALEGLVRGMLEDRRTGRAVDPLAGTLARHGFANTLSQLVIKLTSPGIPDFYQGCELADLSLVDPDNRRPVDFRQRARLLAAIEPHLAAPDPAQLRAWIDAGDERAKLYVIARLLRFRQAHAKAFEGAYRALEAQGEMADHLIAYARESDDVTVLVIVPRFPATLERRGGWGDTRLALPQALAHRTWFEVLTDQVVEVEERLDPRALPLSWAVLVAEEEGDGSPLSPDG